MKKDGANTYGDRFRRWIDDNPAIVLPSAFVTAIGLIANAVVSLINLLGRNSGNENIAERILDPIYVWWVAILLGLAVVFGVIKSFVMRYCYEPQLEDKPLQALRKGKNSKASLAQVKIDNDLTHYFIYREHRNEYWVAPEIKYHWIAATNSTMTEQDFRRCLNKEFDSKEPNYAGRLFELVDKAVRDKKIEVYWDGRNSEYRAGPMKKENSKERLILENSLKPISRDKSFQ